MYLGKILVVLKKLVNSGHFFTFLLQITEKPEKVEKKDSKALIVIKSGDVVGIHWGLGKWFSCPCGCCDLNTCPGIFFIISYVGIL